MSKKGVKEKKNLGAWFPNASVIKTAEYDKNSSISLCLFYQYVNPQWSTTKKSAAMALIEGCGPELNIGGRVRCSVEGLNATISGTHTSTRAFIDKLKEFDENFNETDFKFIDDLPLDRAFKDLKVLPVKELVYYGIDNEYSLGEGGTHLEPDEFHEALKKPDSVVIDVRNGYEYDIGRFDGQMKASGEEKGASLLNPEMRKSTDFPSWLASDETQRQLKGKNVLMYCTGGIRCERASALLRREMGGQVQEVYQLQGGIEKYLQTFPDGGFWQGKNFVFDKREAFDVKDVKGCGGVLDAPEKKKKGAKKNKKRKKDDDDEGGGGSILGRCCVCEKPWDRYIGKKKCKTCEVPVLMCAKCCEQKPEKSDDSNVSMKVRCPLCKKQNCTVLAKDLMLTDNGKKSMKSDATQGKAAPTVLKWGGGNATARKQRKLAHQQNKTRSKEEVFNSIRCKFGADCTRQNCWFNHGEKAVSANGMDGEGVV
jgi:predicted sulfurtransferase